jgi:thiaminase/transcriptional activator TenA
MSPPLSERILAANLDVWDAMQSHRFIEEIEADRLSAKAFKAYLIYECDFVETAMLIFGHMLVKAPGLPQRRWLAGVLQALAVDQITYFEGAFAAIGVTHEDRGRPLPSSVATFRNGMLSIARDGSYFDGVAIMLAAEWTYAIWCSRAAKLPISDPILKQWVGLHAEPAFLAQADWLRRQIDAADPGQARALSQRFRRALKLEIAFHSAPYEGAPP